MNRRLVGVTLGFVLVAAVVLVACVYRDAASRVPDDPAGSLAGALTGTARPQSR